jgi:signal transduction histidine kinase
MGRPTAVLFGNEAWGLPPEVRARADRTVHVPILGAAESLNLAAAASVVLFESVRAREAPAGADEGKLGEIAALMGAAGHDIRSPLTALTGFVGTLAKGWDRFPEEQRREIVEGMLLDGQRVNALVRLVVDAVRVMTGVPLTAAEERSDAGDAARWVADLFARSGDFPEILVEGGAEARADADRLRALILALAEGAMWWAADGPILVRVREEGGTAALEVERRGAGPDPEQVREMFSGPERGGKVGLYAAKLIVDRLEGSLEAEGEGGVRFTLRLPA